MRYPVMRLCCMLLAVEGLVNSAAAKPQGSVWRFPCQDQTVLLNACPLARRSRRFPASAMLTWKACLTMCSWMLHREMSRRKNSVQLRQGRDARYPVPR